MQLTSWPPTRNPEDMLRYVFLGDLSVDETILHDFESLHRVRGPSCGPS